MKKNEFLKLLDECLEGKTKSSRAVDLITDMIEARRSNLAYANILLRDTHPEIDHPIYPESNNNIMCELYPEQFEKMKVCRDYNRTANEINLLRDLLNCI